jgi:hypothetical protein
MRDGARAARGGSPRRWIYTLLFGLWLSEWVLHWSDVFGERGDLVFWLWLAGLVLFAVRSLSRTRLPVGVVVWLWMAAILAVSLVRALWIGHGAPGELFADPAAFEQMLRDIPPDAHGDFHQLAQIARVLSVPAVAAIAGAVLAGLEIFIVAASLAIGDSLRDAPARVRLLPRLGLAALQLPTLLVVPALGIGAIAGLLAVSTTTLVPPAGGVPEEATIVLATVDANSWAILGVGAACWALGAIHLRRLLGLADGGLVTRLVLALFALAPGAVLFADEPGVVWRAAILAWIVLQLGALAVARPVRA